ncbi:DNA polymerase III subunit delta' [candidate division KSB1 bacterium]|nr:DNA polymerase III subunit delta' [candidate division KSB1 bacterium]
MSFTRIIGQETIKNILQSAIEHQRIAHAYLFHGAEGVGKEAMAIEFAKAIFCSSDAGRPCDACSACKRIATFSHPDFIFLFPGTKTLSTENERAILDSFVQQPYRRNRLPGNPSIGIDKIRELRRICTLKPLEKYRVIVIAEADKMTIEAANSLLKILEEPPEFTYLILTTARVNALLQTIVSRCQTIRFGLLADAEIEKHLIQDNNLSPDDAKSIARISQGNYRRALDWLEEDLAKRRADAVLLLRTCFKDLLSQLQMVEDLVKRYDKGVIKEILGLILIWFRDALVLAQGSEQSGRLTNLDQLDTLQKFVGAFEQIDVDGCLTDVEASIEQIDRNAQLNLVLTVLLHRLRRRFTLKETAAVL